MKYPPTHPSQVSSACISASYIWQTERKQSLITDLIIVAQNYYFELDKRHLVNDNTSMSITHPLTERYELC